MSFQGLKTECFSFESYKLIESLNKITRQRSKYGRDWNLTLQ